MNITINLEQPLSNEKDPGEAVQVTLPRPQHSPLAPKVSGDGGRSRPLNHSACMEYPRGRESVTSPFPHLTMIYLPCQKFYYMPRATQRRGVGLTTIIVPTCSIQSGVLAEMNRLQ